MTAKPEKLAVVLFNLGGPDCLKAVRPFLFNLFNDPAIIGAPAPIRWALAKYISGKRAPFARDIYRQIGGKSPLLDLTNQQAQALEQALDGAGQQVKCFVAMRYWHPMTEQTVAEVKAWGPDQVVLLPLYPQFSTATSGSSLGAWHKIAKKAGLKVSTLDLCCWPTQGGMIEAQTELLAKALTKAGPNSRVLFSAHGLPQTVIDKGDPYLFHVEQTAKAIVSKLDRADLDWLISYQSRVGPQKWVEPFTDVEIRRAGEQGKNLVVLPIAFVSEHSETLVELDIEYAHLAKESGVPVYMRVPALNSHQAFIDGLADLVTQGLNGLVCTTTCQGRHRQCPHHPKDAA